jgi:hypothetical protein
MAYLNERKAALKRDALKDPFVKLRDGIFLVLGIDRSESLTVLNQSHENVA